MDGFQWIIDHKEPIIATVRVLQLHLAAWKIVSIVTLAVDAIKKFSTGIKSGRNGYAGIEFDNECKPNAELFITLVSGLVV